MKLLAVLVLAAFAGCNANVLWREPPKSDLEVVKEAFWDYVGRATLTAEESLTQIKQSALGQEVNTKISESGEAVRQYVAALQARATPLAEDLMRRVSQEAELLKTRLEDELSAASADLQPYSDALVRFQTQLEQLKTEGGGPGALGAALLQKSQELRAQVVPHTEELRQKVEQSLEDFQSRLVPLAQSFESQLTQKVQEVQQSLAPSGEQLQAQLSALWDAFTRRTTLGLAPPS